MGFSVYNREKEKRGNFMNLVYGIHDKPKLSRGKEE